MKNVWILLMLILPSLVEGQNTGTISQGQSQSAEKSEVTMDANFSLGANLVAPTLIVPEINTFQKRAIEKVEDFYNYLSIISNPAYAKKMRDEAKKQAKKIFYGSDCTVDDKNAMNYVDSCARLTKSIDCKAVEVIIQENMTAQTQSNDSVFYQGTITFKISSKSGVSEQKTAEMILSKTEKLFGTSKKDVWSVFICKIE